MLIALGCHPRTKPYRSRTPGSRLICAAITILGHDSLRVLKIIPIFAVVISIKDIMPEIFRFFGFSFFFYSREHDPLHVHVEGNGGMAKFEWNGTEFVLVERMGIKAGDFKKIKAVIDENADIIIAQWNKHFNQ